MTDLASLATALLARFRTIHFAPADDCLPSAATHADWWGAAKARRAEKRAVQAYRDHILSGLVRHGHPRFLHHLEPDPKGGWRLHVFVADDLALVLLDQITEGQCVIDDPLSFDPNEFVRSRLEDEVGAMPDEWQDS